MRTECNRNTAGQPVVYDVPGGMVGALSPVAWREQLMMQLLGYAVYHRAQVRGSGDGGVGAYMHACVSDPLPMRKAFN